MVLSILLIIGGALAIPALPIAQYPQITPPTIQVSVVYPGASAQVVADTVAAPIEQQVNGVEGMLYMSSQCTNDGAYTLTVTFDLSVDLNMALVLVQNRVALALPTMPDPVKKSGVTTKKKSPNILLVVNLSSDDPRHDQLFLSNYATLNIRDELARLDGVSDVNFMGQQDFSMRVWLDPGKMAARNLSATDIANALKEQNTPIVAGQLGQPPNANSSAFQLPLQAKGRLNQTQEFGEIVIKVGDDGQVTKLRDVARVELGAKSQDQRAILDGKPCIGLPIYQLPGANALDTADRVRAKMDQLKKRFPIGLRYDIVYDTTPFIGESINEVVKALRDAVILVAIVVLAFLQNWRSAIIPLVAVPVAIVGTFAIMAALGFSLNNLTLFGLVLAVGIVVDDAIVVVEAVEHHIEHGLSPLEATKKAMDEVSGPVIAVALVLCAVFVPCAFITGITGQFFLQFAVTIAVSTVLSAFNSLTLSPALSALLLRSKSQGRDPLQWLLDILLGWFFWLFNFGFRISTAVYVWIVGLSLRLSAVVLLGYVALLGLTYYGFTQMPFGFIPLQDKGYLLINVQLPDSSSLERTHEVMLNVSRIVKEVPGVEHTVGVTGTSILLSANGSNFGSMFVTLEPFHHRIHDPQQNGFRILLKLRKLLYEQEPRAVITVFPAPPVDGLGTAGGFKLMIEDLGDLGLPTLQGQTDGIIEASRNVREVTGLFTVFRANTPQLFADIDRTKCLTMKVDLQEAFNTLQIYLGSLYVNDMNLYGRTWQVNIQADATFRNKAEEIRNLKVRNADGEMVPMGTIANIREIPGPVMVTRYNTRPAAPINGNTSPGVSTGEAIEVMEELATQKLPASMGFEWTEITFMQIKAGNTAMFVFAAAVVLVFLVLAAQYESWALPLGVILVVPMCLLCAIAGVALMRQDINIFTQIGFVVLVGLACKNAILIVEFAKLQHEQGMDIRKATLEACRLRLRPIMMTSLAFILGVVPLLVSQGAGAEMRRTLGLAVFSGMLGVTFFGIFLTPVFFYVIMRWTGGK
jgi:multidrug efflux pump